MKVTFLVRYTTRPGQNLFLGGDIPELGQGRIDRLIPMQYHDQEYWSLTIHLPDAKKSWRYRYYLDEGQGVQPEGEHHRILWPVKGMKEYIQVDNWIDPSLTENVFFTAPFVHHIVDQNAKKPVTSFNHCFKIKWPLATGDKQLALIGSVPELGNWNPTKALIMDYDAEWWEVKVNLAQYGTPINYKYGFVDASTKSWIGFEEGPNRILSAIKANGALTTIHDGYVSSPVFSWRGAGVAIPVFSLRSNTSWGVGEFSDLKLLARWAANTGLKLIQILPVNDTVAAQTWIDSYPYSAISAFALHPLYLNLDVMVGEKAKHLLLPYKKRRQKLNNLDAVDYQEVMALKWEVTRQLFEFNGFSFLNDPGYQQFFKENKHWLESYALFCWFRDKYKTARFHEWPEGHTFSPALLKAYIDAKSKTFPFISFYYFLQYHLHLQLREAVEEAHRCGVYLKGDIPIGVYRYSCDAWVAPEQYFMDQQAGAPPDDFAIKGQNWGFPTYNWPKMEEDNFQWWRNRFNQMSHYFDAFRIDHILGFFRIWSIPMHAVEGILGQFVPAIPLTISDFKLRGIPWDKDRFCTPYITVELLNELFGAEASQVAEKFCIRTMTGEFLLKPEFDQQQKIKQYFEGLPIDEKHQAIKQGLYDLIANILLLEDPNQLDGYHFRISMDQTSSFRDLPEQIKLRLKDLYIDYFYHKQDTFWQQEAMRKLPHLKQSTDMLICGEDLGMVPHSVPKVMKSLGILSLEIQRMPKRPEQEFFIPSSAPYLAVVTPSTHDMSTIRGWWTEIKAVTQRFYNQVLGQAGEAPTSCPSWVNKMIIVQHLESPAMWAIFQWQELAGMDEDLRRTDVDAERINIPAVANHFWRYRMHISLEDLLKEKHFNEHLRHLIQTSGR